MSATSALIIASPRIVTKRLDFRLDVAHGLATRHYSDNIYVELRSLGGETGYGECVPRSYVTGETPESVRAALRDLVPEVTRGAFPSPGAVVSRLEEAGRTGLGAANPAAFCALELALLDLAGHHWNLPAADLLGLPRSASPLTYSLVVPLLPEEALRAFLQYVSGFDFSQVKVKVNGMDPLGRVRRVKSLLPAGIELRVDANCAWTRESALEFTRALAGEGVVSVEQPLPAEDLAGMSGLRGEGVLITLDESVRGPEDVERAARAGACDLVNVRVSKCGGLLGARRVIRASLQNGIAVQLGAQVGESCILSAAGALLAAGTPEFRWREGCFGAYLLREDLCAGEFQFGRGGRMISPSGPGLGVRVERERLER